MYLQKTRTRRKNFKLKKLKILKFMNLVNKSLRDANGCFQNYEVYWKK